MGLDDKIRRGVVLSLEGEARGTPEGDMAIAAPQAPVGAEGAELDPGVARGVLDGQLGRVLGLSLAAGASAGLTFGVVLALVQLALLGVLGP